MRGEVGSYLSTGTPVVTNTDGNVSIEMDAPEATAKMIAELTGDEDPVELSSEEDGVYGYEFKVNGSQTFTITTDTGDTSNGNANDGSADNGGTDNGAGNDDSPAA